MMLATRPSGSLLSHQSHTSLLSFPSGSYSSSPSPLHTPPSSLSTSNLAMQVEDVLVHIFRMLELADLHAMRLVNKRLCVLVSAKVVWIELLQRLALPIPATTSGEIADLSAREIERLAVRAVHLEANWLSSTPTPARTWSLPVDSVVVSMTMCRGVLFTAHKDGVLRCWRDLSENRLQKVGSTSPREDPTRFESMVPEARIVKFTLLQVCVDASETHFVVAYAGDSVDRRTYCGVFRVPVDRTAAVSEQHSAPPPALLFEETKGIVSISVSSTSVVLVRAQGNVSVLDLATKSTYSVDIDALRAKGSGSSKMLRVHALPPNHLLVATTDAVAVYPMPTAQAPHIDIPSFIRPLPRCVSCWVQPASSTSTALPATLTILTDGSAIHRYSLGFSASTAEEDEAGESWDLLPTAQETFPYPVERLTLTEMHGGTRRSVWVHWRRGFEDWPVHVLGANALRDADASNTATPIPSTNASSTPPPPTTTTSTHMTFQSLAAVSSDTPPSNDSLAESVWKSTRSVSMPRMCFDEATGRMCVAGISSATIDICDYV